jgi:hypothetical protein
MHVDFDPEQDFIGLPPEMERQLKSQLRKEDITSNPEAALQARGPHYEREDRRSADSPSRSGGGC